MTDVGTVEVPPRVDADLVRQWDAIARERLEQLNSGIDLSYDNVLVPACLALVGNVRQGGRILDVGCGLGRLTVALARRFGRVVGVDPSRESIGLAEYQIPPDLKGQIGFETGRAQDFAGEFCGEPFAAAVLNMVLMDSPDPADVLRATVSVCLPKAAIVITLPHPWFWPQYSGYASKDWFQYDREIYVESKFRISSELLDLRTTHIHRSLEHYFEIMSRVGLRVEALTEPLPPSSLPLEYLSAWNTPRFIAFRCRRL